VHDHDNFKNELAKQFGVENRTHSLQQLLDDRLPLGFFEVNFVNSYY
jgi:hypothetical protein